MASEKELGQPETCSDTSSLDDELVFRATILALRYLTFEDCAEKAEYWESAKAWVQEAWFRLNAHPLAEASLSPWAIPVYDAIVAQQTEQEGKAE